MVIESLVKYHELLTQSEDSLIAPEGYSYDKISYRIILDEAGRIIDIYDNTKEVLRGKKVFIEPKIMLLPERKTRSGINANFIADNGKYVFGIDNEGSLDLASFKSFKEYNNQILKDGKGECARAFLAYINNFVPENNLDNKKITDLDLTKNFAFALHSPTRLISEDEEIKSLWEASRSNEEKVTGVCSIYGKEMPLARIHDKIKGVRDAQSSGATLVSFNNEVDESYNKTQSYNCPLSIKAMKAYTQALNILLDKDSRQKMMLGDDTAVFWAESLNPLYVEIVDVVFETYTLQKNEDRQELTDKVRTILSKACKGIYSDLTEFNVDPKVFFHFLCLSPNAARLSVRFYYKNSFGTFMKNVESHFQDLYMPKVFDSDAEQIPYWQLLKETVPIKLPDKVCSNTLAAGVTRAMLDGTVYPKGFLSQIIMRCKVDRVINRNRASIIKACINRYIRLNKINKELISMSLNKESKNQAYLTGRLFAVLEKLQELAISGINATIKDKYFASACASPAKVMPSLINLSHAHIKKLSEVQKIYFSKMQGEILNNIEDGFATRLTQEEQGRFILGYYHQRQDFYTKKDTEN